MLWGSFLSKKSDNKRDCTHWQKKQYSVNYGHRISNAASQLMAGSRGLKDRFASQLLWVTKDSNSTHRGWRANLTNFWGVARANRVFHGQKRSAGEQSVPQANKFENEWRTKNSKIKKSIESIGFFFRWDKEFEGIGRNRLVSSEGVSGKCFRNMSICSIYTAWGISKFFLTNRGWTLSKLLCRWTLKLVWTSSVMVAYPSTVPGRSYNLHIVVIKFMIGNQEK